MSAVSRIPLIRLDGNLIVSIQVMLTDEIVIALREDVTRAIERDDVTGLILDISGVDLLDSHMTRCVHDLALVAQLMGVRTIVCGLKPDVAMTLVELGLELPRGCTALNLQRAVEALKASPLAGPGEAPPR